VLLAAFILGSLVMADIMTILTAFVVILVVDTAVGS